MEGLAGAYLVHVTIPRSEMISDLREGGEGGEGSEEGEERPQLLASMQGPDFAGRLSKAEDLLGQVCNPTSHTSTPSPSTHHYPSSIRWPPTLVHEPSPPALMLSRYTPSLVPNPRSC